MTWPRTTPTGGIAIRQATPADAAQVRALRLEALARHPEAFGADHASIAAESVEMWSDRIGKTASGGQGLIGVAVVDDQLIGMMGLIRERWPKTRHSGTIWGVYVKAEWRGLHVAEALLNECALWARAQGVVLLKLGVVTTNTSAIRCYTRCGFAVYGLDPKVIYANAAFHDELLMVKPI